MNPQRPGVFAVRAVNQYRRRDVLTYLSLRYYLNNVAARTDRWAIEVAATVLLGRNEQPYLKVYHFKDTDGRGNANHRQIFLPGANEALAESALLGACAERDIFLNPACVFSYRLSSGYDRRGVFVPYFDGLEARHAFIANACDSNSSAVVLYIDIKQFYPSIPSEIAAQVWDKYSAQAELPMQLRTIGEKLLADHQKASKDNGKGLLTGPMFSHLIGNLILRELDEVYRSSESVQYCRYVDDITLIGTATAISNAVSDIRSRLATIGLELHADDSTKSIEVTASEWITSRHDYKDSTTGKPWAALIGEMKRYLLLRPEGRDVLGQAFRESGYRIPVFDYSNAVFESSYLSRVTDLAKRCWYRRKAQKVRVESLLNQARSLRTRYREEFLKIAEETRLATPFQRKRRIPKLRYRAGRLVYLASDETLIELSSVAMEIPELYFHAQVMLAVATGDVDKVLSSGTNAAQAMAQPLRAIRKICKTSQTEFSDVQIQSLAVLTVNGVDVMQPPLANAPTADLMQVARTGANVALMKKAEPFVRELACLHGITEKPRHPEMLESVFDRDEKLAMDAIDQLQQSVSP